MCAIKRCQSVTKVSRDWAITLHQIYMHDKITTVENVCFKFLEYSPSRLKF